MKSAVKKTAVKKTAKHKARGILPSDRWLRANGFEGMADAVKKNPERFAHIEQKPSKPAKANKPASKPAKPKTKATNAEHIKMAKVLAKNSLFTIQIESSMKQADKAVAAGATEKEGLAAFFAAVEKALTVWAFDKKYNYPELRAAVLRFKFPAIFGVSRKDEDEDEDQ